MKKLNSAKENALNVEMSAPVRHIDLMSSFLSLFTDSELVQTVMWITLVPAEELEFAD
ncbi:MAG: hypothetical protein ABIN80_23815 [Dyadobacter sp.]|uniref:hypothetical protein n=1 Tax=Dyadobacter sp. TaxID=1914288 RepID=UPI003267860C